MPATEPARGPAGDGVVWLPLMGRMGSVAAHVPAMVLNIAPCRVAPEPAASLTSVLQAIRQDRTSIRQHGRCRIEQIAADFGLGEGERFFFSPLINVMPFGDAQFPGWSAAREVLAAGPGDGFNITISADPRAEGLVLHLDADPSLTSQALFEAHVAGMPSFLKDCMSAGADSVLADLAGC